MGPLGQIERHKVAMAALLMVLLACSPLERLRPVSQQPEATSSGAAVVRANSQLIARAYQTMATLPGYRLETRHLVRDEAGQPGSQVIISTTYDPAGNLYQRRQAPDGSQTELYVVDGRAYRYEPEYAGWLDGGLTPAAEPPLAGEISLIDSMRWLTQFGAVPTPAGHETLNNRSVTRYRLDYVVANLAQTFGQELAAGAAVDLRGVLWIDDETGALLKSEILLYEGQANQPSHEFRLEVSDIGQIEPIVAPSPLVDPAAMIAATATAQAWTVLTTDLTYQGEQVTFEVIPLQANPSPNSSPAQAEVQLILRQLPASLFRDVEPFLAQLRAQLTLSIPKRNLVVPSSGYRLEKSHVAGQTIEVRYNFNADLEDFSYVELIVAGVGNPQFAPVPVERNEQLEIKN
jgi:hypothetical protein